MNLDLEIELGREKLIGEALAERNPKGVLFVLPFLNSKKFASYSLIRDDINFTRDCFSRLLKARQQKKRDTVIESSLFYAGVIQYGRCFNTNDGGYTSLNENQIFAEGKHLLIHHNNLMDYRNGFVAHRNRSKHEQALAFIELTPKDNSNSYTAKMTSRYLKTTSPNENLLKNYLEVCDYLIPKIEFHIEKHAQRTAEGFNSLSDEEKLSLQISEKKE